MVITIQALLFTLDSLPELQYAEAQFRDVDMVELSRRKIHDAWVALARTDMRLTATYEIDSEGYAITRVRISRNV